MDRRIIYTSFERFSIVGLALLLLYLITRMWYEHDDYAYATFTYAFDENAYQEFSFNNFFLFIKNHYFNWGGRIIAYSFLSLLLQFDPVIFSSITYILILFTIYLYTQKALFQNLKIIISFLFILSIPLPLFSNGVMWMAASVGYFWGVLLLLITIKMLQTDTSVYIKMLLCFIVSFWQENVSLAMFLYVTLSLFYADKENRKQYFFCAICSIIGLVLLLSAPGNLNRMEESYNTPFFKMNFIMRTICRIDEQIQTINTVSDFNFLLVLVVVYYSSIYFMNKKSNFYLCLLITMFSIVLMCMNAVFDKEILGYLFFVNVFISTVYVLVVNTDSKIKINLIIIWCLYFSPAIAPWVGPRLLVPVYVYICFVILDINITFRTAFSVVLFFCLYILFWSYDAIIDRVEGYKEAYAIHKKNERVLLDNESQSFVIEDIDHRYIGDPIAITPYQLKWIKFFYNIKPEKNITIVKHVNN